MKVLVTGGTGFLGKYVVEALAADGHDPIPVGSKDYDLLDDHAVFNLFYDHSPEMIVHLAARVGGIGDNYERPGDFIYENALMGLKLMESARKHGVYKFLTAGTACMYPASARIPQNEEDIWNGLPAYETVAYAQAKRLILAQGIAYREQFDFNAIMVIPSNLYGPRDESTHVVPSLIRKIGDAVQNEEESVTLWGTGNASRDFLYVQDAAQGIVAALNYYEGELPLNLGSGIEVPIFGLARTIKELYGYEGKILWDIMKPEGTRRRCLDTSRAKKYVGWYATTQLSKGLEKTINWYEGMEDE